MQWRLGPDDKPTHCRKELDDGLLDELAPFVGVRHVIGGS